MKHIYKYFFAVGALLFTTANLQAQDSISANGVAIGGVDMERVGNRLQVEMLLDISELHVRSNRSLRLTPVVTDGRELVQLPAVVIDGRRRSIVHEREQSALYESIDTYVRRHNRRAQVVEYDADVQFEGWMEQSELVLREEWCSCHDVPLSEDLLAVSSFKQSPQQTATTEQPAQSKSSVMPQPRMAYVMPQMGKMQNSFEPINIYFAVNKSDINPSFMDNNQEIADLGEALSRSGVKSIHLKGYASPEGPYEFNKALAARRAEAVKQHLQSRGIQNNISITTDSSPANWDAVKHLLSTTYIENWRGIVAIIDDGSIALPDKNAAIKAKYPVEYDFMLSTWYPKLRLTEISVDGGGALTVEEAKRMMQSAPSQLRLEDIYMVALTYERGSKEWNDIIIFAVQNYPQSAEARVNAANVAMANGDYAKAKEYLQGVPASMPEAINSRGILAMAEGNYSEAMTLFQQAERDGVQEATYNISLLKELFGKQ